MSSIVLLMMSLVAAAPAGESTPTTEEAMYRPTEPLTVAHHAILEQHGWIDWVGTARAVWVCVDEQMFRIIENGEVIWQALCSTAANGTGSEAGSYKTPLGWHRIAEKYGANAPWGQVFVARQPTRTVWQPGDDTERDLVLTRILWLDGLEPGKNSGPNIDSYLRYIYIHGTNGEEDIGTPASMGCVRLLNDDVIEAYELLPVETRVLITEMRK